MKKILAKKLTIDDLAAMVANGFSSMDEKFSDKFDRIDKRFDGVDSRFDKIEKDIDEVKENLATTRMDVLGIGDKFVSRHDFNQHLIRFDLLEKKVKVRK